MVSICNTYLDYITESMNYPKYDVSNFYKFNYPNPERVAIIINELNRLKGDKPNMPSSPIKKNLTPTTLQIKDDVDSLTYYILTPLVNIDTASVSIYNNGTYGKCLKLEYENKEFNGITYTQTATYAICVKDNQELDEENMELKYEYELGDLVSIKIPIKDKSVKKYFVTK